MKTILVAVTTIFWVSMMNKLYYGCQFWYVTILFWYVTILFSSNKLLNLKYIHCFFFLKFPTKISRCVLCAGAFYGPRNTVIVQQVTIKRRSKCPQTNERTQWHVWSWTVPLKRSPGGWQLFGRQTNTVVKCPFSIGA